MNVERIKIKQEKCDIKKHFGNFKNLFESIDGISNYYCAVPGKNITIFSMFSSDNVIFMGHYISRCVNDTSANRTNCKDTKLIQTS